MILINHLWKWHRLCIDSEVWGTRDRETTGTVPGVYPDVVDVWFSRWVFPDWARMGWASIGNLYLLLAFGSGGSGWARMWKVWIKGRVLRLAVCAVTQVIPEYRVRHFGDDDEEIPEAEVARENVFPPTSAGGSSKCPGKDVGQCSRRMKTWI